MCPRRTGRPRHQGHPSTVWEIPQHNGIKPAPQRDHQTSAGFLRSQAHAIPAADFFETRTLTGTRLYVFAAIEHATRRVRVRVLGATAHPTAARTTQLARNLVMDLQDVSATVKTGVRVPRMNAVTERWVRSCRTELLDRTLIVNQAHLLHALREHEAIYNQHRPPPNAPRHSTSAPTPPTDHRTGTG